MRVAAPELSGNNRRQQGLAMSTPRLEVKNVTKRYPSVVANSDVSLVVAPGEIHAVLGRERRRQIADENHLRRRQADEGEVRFDGKPSHIRNPQEARCTRHQHGVPALSLFETVTVAENIWLWLDKSLRSRTCANARRARRRNTASTLNPTARCIRCRSVSGSASKSCVRCYRSEGADPR